MQSCLSMDPAEGYNTARAILKDRYGQSYKIATTLIDQVTKSPQIKAVLLCKGTVLPESIYPLGRGKTSSLPKGSAANSPRWDEFLNLVLDGRDRMTRQARRGIPR